MGDSTGASRARAAALVFALAAVGCAAPGGEPPAGSLGALDWSAGTPAGPAAGEALWSASASSRAEQGLFSLFSASASYDVLAGNARGIEDASPTERTWRGTVASHRLSRKLSARLPPALAGGPLEMEWGARQEQGFGDSGAFLREGRSTRARWAPGPWDIALTPGEDYEQAQGCLIDARWQAGGSGSWRDPRRALRGQRCRRDVAQAEQADLWTASAGWDLGFGESGVRLTGVEAHALAGAGARRALELGASQALDLAGWSLQGELAWQPPADPAQAEALWASRASVRRTFWNAPVTAAWQRSQPAMWTQQAQPAGREASVALDLAPSLRPWIGPWLGADLSYRWFQPEAQPDAIDDRITMNLRLGW